MIERGEFALQDLKTKCRLSLNDRWLTQFYPGMRVAMDIVLSFGLTFGGSLYKCPKCGRPSMSLGYERLW
jgi:hypothetical protein